jgi:hypothetical protein
MTETAVEFLLEKYKSQNTLLFADNFEQAIEMEKQQGYSEKEVLAFGQFCIGKVADFLDGKGDQTDGQEHSIEDLFDQFKNK